MATYYLAALTEKGKRRLHAAAKACGARFASRGTRGILRGEARCVWLRAGMVSSVHHRDDDTFVAARKAWL